MTLELRRMSRLKADSLLLAVAALWGVAFVAQKSAMASIGPLTFIAARTLLASMVLAPLAIWESRKQPHAISPSFLKMASLAACALLIGSTLQQFGLLTATVTNASFLTALYAVYTPFVAWLMLKTPPAAVVWPATALSFIGVWLLGGATIGALSVGDALIAISAPLWAFHIVVTGLGARAGRPFLFTALQFGFVAIVASIAAVAFEAPALQALRDVGWQIAYVGIVSSAVTFTIFTIAMRHAPAAEAALILSTENLFAALAGGLLIGDRLGAINWMGASLIIAAVLLVQFAIYRRQPAACR